MIHIEIYGKEIIFCGIMLLAFLPQIHLFFIILTVEIVEILNSIRSFIKND
jgi:hypothetical protein